MLQLIEHESSAPSTGHGLERTLNRQSSPAAIRALQVQQAIEAENAPRVQVIPAADATSATNPMSSAPRMLSAPVACETNLGSLSLPAASDEKLLSNFTAQTLRGLTAMLHQRGGSMTLRLDPPDLGELRIHMTITRGVVVADFQASASHTQSLLDRNLTMLRHSLEGQGLTVERLTVHAPTSGGNSHLGNFARDDSAPSQHSWSNQHDAAGSESRGRREHSEAAHREPWFSPEIDAREVSFASLMDFSDRTKSRRSIRAIAP